MPECVFSLADIPFWWTRFPVRNGSGPWKGLWPRPPFGRSKRPGLSQPRPADPGLGGSFCIEGLSDPIESLSFDDRSPRSASFLEICHSLTPW